VIEAIEKMVTHLRLYKQTPPHGLAVFSGNIGQPGQTDVKVWSIEPPEPINLRLYRCDKAFVLDPLHDLLEVKEVYGLVVMDRRDATIALLKGKSIIPLVKTHSEVPGKFKTGGQSAKRFAANRELAAKAHYKKVADHMKDQFLMRTNLKGILVGGPGPTKYDLVEGNFITADVKKKILAIKDITYTDMFGVQELVERSQDVLAEEEIAKEKKVMTQFFYLLSIKPGMVAYGEKNVRNALELGAVDLLLLSEDLEDKTIEELEETAEKYNTAVKMISTETREGVQLREIGKIGAMLRYELKE